MNSGASCGGSGRRRQAVGLSLKIWSACAPIWRDRRAAGISPFATPMCMPTRGAEAGHVRRRRGSGRARVRAMPDDPTGSPEPQTPTTDLLGVGLLVFFVALIGVVAALLILPAIF